MTENLYPDGKKFAFTVFDDTDGSTVENVKPVYDFLEEIGLTTTKSVWVFPPRGRDAGSCLQDAEYLVFIKHLASRGFEVGLHNVGDGCFSRKEIIEGFGVFRNLLGYYPAIHANHRQSVLVGAPLRVADSGGLRSRVEMFKTPRRCGGGRTVLTMFLGRYFQETFKVHSQSHL